MDIKIHGGPVITVPAMAGVDRSTRLVVHRHPEETKARSVKRLDHYLEEVEDKEPTDDFYWIEPTPEEINGTADESPLTAVHLGSLPECLTGNRW